MTVKILSLKKGVEKIENVDIIRVKSKKYNLMIMQNYASIIGEIDGNIEIVGKNVDRKLENIKGYYINIDNIFKLMVND